MSLHGFLLTYQISLVNQDQHQECGTAVVEEVVQDQVVLAELVEVIQPKVLDMQELVLVEHLYQALLQLMHYMPSSHQVLVVLEALVDQVLLIPVQLI